MMNSNTVNFSFAELHYFHKIQGERVSFLDYFKNLYIHNMYMYIYYTCAKSLLAPPQMQFSASWLFMYNKYFLISSSKVRRHLTLSSLYFMQIMYKQIESDESIIHGILFHHKIFLFILFIIRYRVSSLLNTPFFSSYFYKYKGQENYDAKLEHLAKI